MPNHFHILIKVHDARNLNHEKMDPLSRKLGTLQSSYTRAINKWKDRSGSLFQQKIKAKQLKSEHQQLVCFHYIHQNPVKAKLVKEMRAWEFSSFSDFAWNRDGSLLNKELARKFLQIPYAETDFIIESKKVISNEEILTILDSKER
ncbi:MAG: hypothetical protein Tsb0034_21140 [Ekhidna sp.]